MTVRVDDVRGVAGFILPGDFVDVVLIKTDDEQVRRENYSEILLQRVKVLATGQTLQSSGTDIQLPPPTQDAKKTSTML